MNITLSQVLAFVLKYWPRISLALFLFFLLNKKQIDIQIQLGSPPHSKEAAALIEGAKETNKASLSALPRNKKTSSWAEKLNIFGSNTESLELYEALKMLPEEKVAAFLERFSSLAKEEQQKYGIPASIILANGLLQSTAGGSEAALRANNYFNLPATPDWVGQQFRERSQLYRSYQNAWTSFRDHSLFLTTGQYAKLQQLGKTDYQRWAKAMEKQGFGDSRLLAKQLVLVIDDWQLFRLD